MHELELQTNRVQSNPFNSMAHPPAEASHSHSLLAGLGSFSLPAFQCGPHRQVHGKISETGQELPATTRQMELPAVSRSLWSSV